MIRSVGGAVLAVAILGAGIARLRRIERPVFEVTSASPDGVAQLGRVRLARRGEHGHVLGWALRCRGREVWSHLGASPGFELLPTTEGPLRVRESGAAGHGFPVACPSR